MQPPPKWNRSFRSGELGVRYFADRILLSCIVGIRARLSPKQDPNGDCIECSALPTYVGCVDRLLFSCSIKACTSPFQISIYRPSSGLDWRRSVEVKDIVFDSSNSLLILPDPVRKERYKHEMGDGLALLVHLERSGIGKIG